MYILPQITQITQQGGQGIYTLVDIVVNFISVYEFETSFSFHFLFYA